MARVKLTLPEKFIFSTNIDVRITDINYGGHLGNDSVLSIMHEARMRLFKEYGFTELDVDGVGIIMTDTAIVYKGESYYGDRLEVNMAVSEISRLGCDIFYHITLEDGKEIVRAKTGIAFFNYDLKKVVSPPGAFIEAMGK